MNAHVLLCWLGIHWWRTAPRRPRRSRIRFRDNLDFCRVCGKVKLQ